jgi:uncharacterized protein YndB with AHSA1/START domain
MSESRTQLAPVSRDVVVAAPIETCYRVFVEEMGTWWPVEHHILESPVAAMKIEKRVGGRLYDVDEKGGECRWGTVLALNPPHRFAFAWHVQPDWTVDVDPARQSEVEVTFTAVDPNRTSVHLEHRNLERHGDGSSGLREAVDSAGGWTISLARLSDVLEGRPPRPLEAA